MSVNSVSSGVTQPTNNPVNCVFKKGSNGNTITFTYENGAQTSVTCKDGKYTKSGHVKPGNIGAYTGFEMTKEEAEAWFTNEASKLPGSKTKLNVQG